MNRTEYMRRHLSVFFLLCMLPGAAAAEPVSGLAAAGLESASAGSEDSDPAAVSDLISVEFNNADIQSVLKILAMKGDVNIVASPEVQGKVTMQLKDVPWMSAFETIVRTYGFVYETDGDIYRIITPESREMGREEVYGTEVFTFQYVHINDVSDTLRSVLSSSAVVEPVPGTNQLVITDETANLERIREVVAKIDRRMEQVHIETRIVQTELSEGENLGVNWNLSAGLTGAVQPTTFPFSPDPDDGRFSRFLQQFNALPLGQTAQEQVTSVTSGGGQTQSQTTDFPLAHGFPFVDPDDFRFGTIDFSQFRVMMNMLKNRDSTKVISNPRIVVMNHQSARIQVGQEVGIPILERNENTGTFEVTGFEPRNTGIVLNVTPHVSQEREIMLRVRPEVTSAVQFQAITSTNLTAPTVDTIVAETSVIVNSGDTLVIGGLISETDRDNRSKVPLLSRVPVLGWAFKHKSPQSVRKETIFFITVTIADEVFNRSSLERWNKAQEAYEEYRRVSEEEFLGEKKKKTEKKAA